MSNHFQAMAQAAARFSPNAPDIRSALRMLGVCLLAISPMFIASLVLSDWLTIMVVLVVTGAVFYPLTKEFQADLFRLPLRQTHLLVCWPLNALFLGWVLLLVLLHRKFQLGSAVLPGLLLWLTAVFPLFRPKSSAATARKLPYLYLYCFVAIVVLSIEVAMLWSIS